MSAHRPIRPTSEFRQTLRALEDAVNLPIVPGEHETWCGGVGSESRRTAVLWQALKEDHRALFEQITQEDMDLVQRVEVLEDKQAALDRRLTELRAEVEELLEDHLPQDSSEPVKLVESLRQGYFEWIVGVRALEKEIETWLLEAYQRDRGVAD